MRLNCSVMSNHQLSAKKMVQNAISDQGPKGIAGEIAKLEGIGHLNVYSLCLDFKNILKIESLWRLTNLTKLQLDNNIIDQIEGLEKLVNLKWLDLSFNNIKSIKGLDTLVELEDLSLFSNRIKKLENMESLKKLQVFSIGNNELNDMNEMIYLRQFRNLKTLCVRGNPLCENDDHQYFITAHLLNLVYLDYKMIRSDMRHQAEEMYMSEIDELSLKDSLEEDNLKKQKERATDLALHKLAHVDRLDADTLFEDMYANDTEGKLIQEYEPIKELVDSYKESFVQKTKEIFQYGLAEHNKRESEVKEFDECLGEAKRENTGMSRQLVDKFTEEKNELFPDMLNVADSAELDRLTDIYTEKGSALSSQLTWLEVQLSDQLEDTIKEFERNMIEMIGVFCEQLRGMFVELRALENKHHESVAGLCVTLLNCLVTNKPEVEELSEDLKMLFVDKDAVNNARSASHELHIQVIDAKEEAMINGAQDWLTNLVSRAHEEERKRSRQRILEISHFVDYQQEELENFEIETEAHH